MPLCLLPGSWQFWRQYYWRAALLVNTYIIYQVDTSTSGRGHRLHYPWASVLRIGIWLKENSTTLQHFPFCLLTGKQESRILSIVKALENSTRRSKSAFQCAFSSLWISAIITAPPWSPPSCFDRLILLYASFWHFSLQYSQTLGRDIVKLIINNTVHIKTAPFQNLKPTSAFWKLTQAYSKQQNRNYIKKFCGTFLLSSQLPLILLPWSLAWSKG